MPNKAFGFTGKVRWERNMWLEISWWLKQDITSSVCDVISNAEDLFILATLCTHTSLLWRGMNACFSCTFCVSKTLVSTATVDFLFFLFFFFSVSWRNWFERWVHVLHMCGPSAQGTHPRIPDTRVHAEAVVQRRVDKQCSYWPLGTLHIQTMSS